LPPGIRLSKASLPTTTRARSAVSRTSRSRSGANVAKGSWPSTRTARHSRSWRSIPQVRLAETGRPPFVNVPYAPAGLLKTRISTSTGRDWCDDLANDWTRRVVPTRSPLSRCVPAADEHVRCANRTNLAHRKVVYRSGEPMRVSFLTTVAVFAIVHTLTTLSTTASSGDIQEDRMSSMGAILTLDAAIQKRFEKFDRAFGIGRMGYIGHGFAPRNAAEISSLRELVDAHLQVVFYLGCRGLLGSETDKRRTQVLVPMVPIKGPIYMTHGRSSPDARSVWSEARRAFAAFERKEPYYDFE